VIGVSKPVLVKRPYIQIPLARRTISQWESVPIIENINNPYFSGGFPNPTVYQIVPANFTVPPYIYDYDSSPTLYGYRIGDPTTLISFPPGLYKIRCFVYNKWWDNGAWDMFLYKLDYSIPIRNTTFRVVQNELLLTITNNTKTFRCDDVISFSLTTSQRVPLQGPFEIWGYEPATNSYDHYDLITQSNTVHI
jgi:hypothetical protein